jgi:hypothetical protein
LTVAKLVVEFFTFEHKPCIKGVALSVTVKGRAAWRTAVGLRVGGHAAGVRALNHGARENRRATAATGS